MREPNGNRRSTMSTLVVVDDHLPSVLFAIPFPRPANQDGLPKSSPPLFLFTFPRSVYEKPPVDPETGKPGKEKIVKKVERNWQQGVRQGYEIKRGEHKEAGFWKRFKGGAARIGDGAIKYMSDNTMETLGRLPPKRKLGAINVVYPAAKDSSPALNIPGYNEFELKEAFTKMLKVAKNRAARKTVISGVLLPICFAIDFITLVPMPLFEGALAYFTLHVNGARKANAINSAENRAKKRPVSMPAPARDEENNEEPLVNSLFSFEQAEPFTFNHILQFLYFQCSKLDKKNFPPALVSAPEDWTLDTNDVQGIIAQFEESLPEEVTKRHLLNAERVAEDLTRTLTKAAKEYVKSLKKFGLISR
ncbi:secreted protein [Melampsora americana]|nr:secreted protein [Melampsora americana]